MTAAAIFHKENATAVFPFYTIAILVNNAFKAVQQSAKDREDISRRAELP